MGTQNSKGKGKPSAVRRQRDEGTSVDNVPDDTNDISISTRDSSGSSTANSHHLQLLDDENNQPHALSGLPGEVIPVLFESHELQNVESEPKQRNDEKKLMPSADEVNDKRTTRFFQEKRQLTFESEAERTHNPKYRCTLNQDSVTPEKQSVCHETQTPLKTDQMIFCRTKQTRDVRNGDTEILNCDKSEGKSITDKETVIKEEQKTPTNISCYSVPNQEPSNRCLQSTTTTCNSTMQAVDIQDGSDSNRAPTGAEVTCIPNNERQAASSKVKDEKTMVSQEHNIMQNATNKQQTFKGPTADRGKLSDQSAIPDTVKSLEGQSRVEKAAVSKNERSKTVKCTAPRDVAQNGGTEKDLYFLNTSSKFEENKHSDFPVFVSYKNPLFIKTTANLKRILTEEHSDNRKLLEEIETETCNQERTKVYSNVIFFPDKSKGAAPKRYGPKRLGSMYKENVSQIDTSEDEKSIDEQENTCNISLESKNATVMESPKMFDTQESMLLESNTGVEHDEPLDDTEQMCFVEDYFGLYSGLEATGVSKEFKATSFEVTYTGTEDRQTNLSSNQSDRITVLRFDRQPSHSPGMQSETLEKLSDAHPKVSNNEDSCQNDTKEGAESSATGNEMLKVDSKSVHCEIEYCTICKEPADLCSCLFPSEMNKTVLSVYTYRPDFSYKRFLKIGCKEINWDNLKSKQALFIRGLKSLETNIAADNRLIFEFKLPMNKGLSFSIFEPSLGSKQVDDVLDIKDTVEFAGDIELENSDDEVNFLKYSLQRSGSIDSNKRLIVNDFDECSEDEEELDEKECKVDKECKDEIQKNVQTESKYGNKCNNETEDKGDIELKSEIQYDDEVESKQKIECKHKIEKKCEKEYKDEKEPGDEKVFVKFSSELGNDMSKLGVVLSSEAEHVLHLEYDLKSRDSKEHILKIHKKDEVQPKDKVESCDQRLSDDLSTESRNETNKSEADSSACADHVSPEYDVNHNVLNNEETSPRGSNNDSATLEDVKEKTDVFHGKASQDSLENFDKSIDNKKFSNQLAETEVGNTNNTDANTSEESNDVNCVPGDKTVGTSFKQPSESEFSADTVESLEMGCEEKEQIRQLLKSKKTLIENDNRLTEIVSDDEKEEPCCDMHAVKTNIAVIKTNVETSDEEQNNDSSDENVGSLFADRMPRQRPESRDRILSQGLDFGLPGLGSGFLNLENLLSRLFQRHELRSSEREEQERADSDDSDLDLTLPPGEFMRRLEARRQRRNAARVPKRPENATSEFAKSFYESAAQDVDVSNLDSAPSRRNVFLIEGERNEDDSQDERPSDDSSDMMSLLSSGSRSNSPEVIDDEQNEQTDAEQIVLNDLWKPLLEEQKRLCLRNTCLPEDHRCTILCVDASENMQGQPWEQVQDFIQEFASGLEKKRREGMHEEFVALVTFGFTTEIELFPTNVYKQLCDKIETIKPGGLSPFVPGLAMCLLFERTFRELGYKTCSLHEIRMKHRIILVTGGRPTPTLCTSVTNQFHEEACQEMLSSLEEWKLHLRQFVVDCVPVGEKADMDFLKSVCERTSGRLVFLQDVQLLVNSTHNHYKAAQISHQLFQKKEKEFDIAQFRSLVKTLYPDTASADMEEMVTLVQSVQVVSGQRKCVSGHDSGSDAEEEHFEWKDRVNTPTVGMRVMKGPDLPGQYVEIVSERGTVISHSKKHKDKVHVHWDSGINTLSSCVPEKFEVLPANEQSEQYDVDGDVRIGHKVRRGPDWSYENQDGGSDQLGTVYGVQKDGVILVKWPNGIKGNYRYIDGQTYDVVLSDPADPYGRLKYEAEMNKRNREKQ